MTRRSTLAFSLIAALGFPAVVHAEPTLSDDDAWMIQDSAQSSMEYAKTNQTTVWQNPDTGASGAITPVVTYQNDQGEYCREYQQTVTIGGQQQQAYGTACRMPDGAWEVVSSEPVEDPQPAPPSVVYRDSVVYQPAPSPTYAYPILWPFALSFAWYDGRWGGSIGWGGYPYGYFGGYYAGGRPYYRNGYGHGRYYRHAGHGGHYRGGHKRGGHYRGGHQGGGHYRGGHQRGGNQRAGSHRGGGSQRVGYQRGGNRGGGRQAGYRR
jgi:surface antigen